MSIGSIDYKLQLKVELRVTILSCNWVKRKDVVWLELKMNKESRWKLFLM